MIGWRDIPIHSKWPRLQRALWFERRSDDSRIVLLFRAYKKGSLRPELLVPARGIASSGDKDFANNVAVNQNNQNQLGTGFLRSNDPRVVQLDHSLAALGSGLVFGTKRGRTEKCYARGISGKSNSELGIPWKAGLSA
jgi:hypothetical protein